MAKGRNGNVIWAKWERAKWERAKWEDTICPFFGSRSFSMVESVDMAAILLPDISGSPTTTEKVTHQ
jgi:hypothetical protein